jgi:hypothetical protein
MARSSQAEVEVWVDDQRWRQVESLVEAGPRERVYAVDQGEGQATIRFGDGERGRRPAAGATIRAALRQGGGQAGNVGVVTLERTQTEATDDEVLWTVIRASSDSISFRRYEKFMDE